MSAEGRRSSTVGTIFRKELRELLRDRRAVFFAFVLPLFLYPLIFLVTSALPKAHEEELESKRLTVGVSGSDPGLENFLREDDRLDLVEAEPSEVELREESKDLFVEFESPGRGPMKVTVRYLQTVPGSREAHRRIGAVLARLEESLLAARFDGLGRRVDVDGLLRIDPTDVSRAAERSAVGLGKLLPALLIVLLMTGGAFAAIDLVAGEKERGTLETLYVQSVSAAEIAFGKFLVVLVSSIASVLLNVVGLLVAVLSGLTPAGLGGDVLVIPSAGNIGLVLLLLVPFAVLTSALLLAMSSYARSYREAQTYLLPLTILILVPIGLAAAPQVELSSVVAIVPVANVALATREAIGGRLELLPLALVLGSTCLYASWMLHRTTRLLAREEVVLVIEPPPMATDASVEGRRRRALAFGALTLLWVFFAAGWLQGGSDFGPIVGTVLTLWGAVLAPALLYPVFTRRGLARTLGLRRPTFSSLALVVPMAVACSIVMAGYLRLQNLFLPFPEAFAEEMERFLSLKDLSIPVAFFVFALSPGVCEEMLWRGAFQGDVAARGRTWRTVLIVGIFFGVFHFSAHRFVPTAVVGGLLALVRLRSGSLFPCMVLHTVYNAVTLFVISRIQDEPGGWGRWLLEPWSVLIAVGVVVACTFGLRRHTRVDSG